MKTITFSGHSDDIIAVGTDADSDVNGVAIDNHYCDDSYYLLSSSEGHLAVKGKYGAGGTWHFFPFIIEEDVLKLPFTATTTYGDNGYTMELTLEVPDDTTIEAVQLFRDLQRF